MIESTLTFDLLGLVAVVVLVLLNGFFVAAEFSLVSVRQTRIAELVEAGNAKAETVQLALKNPDRVIAATQLGITLASLGLGWIGEPALSHLIEPLLDLFPIELRSGLSHQLICWICIRDNHLPACSCGGIGTEIHRPAGPGENIPGCCVSNLVERATV